MLAAALFAGPLPAQAASRLAAAKAPDLAQVSQQVILRTNAFRASNGLASVASSNALAEAAQRFADYMAKTDRYGHEADGRPPEQRAIAHGYEYCTVAENIAFQMSSLGFDTDELAMRLVEGWEQSPGHRRNMLLPNVTDIGVGVAFSERSQRYYAVQMFGRPRSAASRFEIANGADVAVRYALEGKDYALAPRVTRTHAGCFVGTLQVRWPDGSEAPAVTPRDGARYTVSRDAGGSWQLLSP